MRFDTAAIVGFTGATAAMVSPSEAAGLALALITGLYTLRKWWILEVDRRATRRKKTA